MPSPPSLAERAELAALEPKATPAPWVRVSHREFGETIYQGVTEGRAGDVAGDGEGWVFQCAMRPKRARDAALIVAARNALPGLLVALADTEAERDALRKVDEAARELHRAHNDDDWDAEHDWHKRHDENKAWDALEEALGITDGDEDES